MKEVNIIENGDLLVWASDILKIGNEAVRKAKAENKALGLPEVFVRNGKLFYQLSNGTITEERPEILKK